MGRQDFVVKFWGVRGSVPVSGAQYARYGGNTACVEVRCGGRRVILDAGSGIRLLGLELQALEVRDVDLLIGHCHYDHIIGLPFFAPVFDAAARIRIHAGHLDGPVGIRDTVRDLMRHPFFPVGPEVFAADIAYRDFTAGETLDLGDGIRVATAALNHPGGCTGYRIEFDGRSLAYVSDHEQGAESAGDGVLRLIDKADAVVFDAMYTDAEYAGFVGYGHSTWQTAARLCRAAGAKRLYIFHHRPRRNDAELAQIAAEARATWKGAVVARDGQVVTL